MAKKTNFFERILQVIDYKGFKSVNDFALNGLGYKSPEKLNRLRSDSKKPSVEILLDISNKFEEIDAGWLLTGWGNMLKSAVEIKDRQQLPDSNCIIPLFPIEAYAGIGAGDMIVSESDIEKYYYVPEFKSADFLIPVIGSSMVPKYNGGDLLACKHIQDLTFFQWGRPHVMNINDRGVFVKRPYEGKNEDTIELRSDNKRYPPFEVHRREILNISVVIGAIRLE